MTDRRFRGRLRDRGDARAMIWKDGVLPDGAPDFARDLSLDLLEYGFWVLGECLRLREERDPVDAELLERGFTAAAEVIEAAVRDGSPDVSRGFHLTVAAAAYHLAHLGARSFVLLEGNPDALNLSSPERLLVALMRRDLRGLTTRCADWLSAPEHSDEAATAQLAEGASDFGMTDAVRLVIEFNYHRAVCLRPKSTNR